MILNVDARAVLTQINYRWKWLVREFDGELLAFDNMPHIHEYSGRWTTVQGNCVSLMIVDNGAFDEVVAGDKPVFIGELTNNTFFRK